MNELIEKVAMWAYARHLHTCRAETQYVKLMEEAGELASDLCKGRDPRDSIGDVMVVLIILCLILKVKPEECLQIAYDEIKDRKGRILNGVFVKEADLPEEYKTE